MKSTKLNLYTRIAFEPIFNRYELKQYRMRQVYVFVKIGIEYECNLFVWTLLIHWDICSLLAKLLAEQSTSLKRCTRIIWKFLVTNITFS